VLYAFLFIWFCICLLLFVAGSPSITSANDEIGESD